MPAVSAPRWLRSLGTRISKYLGSFSPTGLVLALVFLCASMAPSLIPRNWYFQGLLSGLSMIAGYGMGTTVGAVTRWLGFTTPWSARVKMILWLILAGVTAIAVPVFTVLGANWQTELRLLFGMPGEGPSRIISQLFLGIAIAIGLLGIGRLLRRSGIWVSRKLSRWIPRRAAILASVLIVAFLTVSVLEGTLINGTLRTLNNLYEASDKGYPANREQPTSAQRSGSEQSLSSWDSLGLQGRRFVTDNPTLEEIREFAPKSPALADVPVQEPIRVYAGLDPKGSLKETAKQVVAELDRTNAWDREVLAVVTATGTGWIDPAFTATFELMHGGNTAIASMQYSYLPSWVGFITDRDTPPAAGRALFEAVYEAWLEKPEDSRPKLYVFGLSLGSYGMQGAFSGLQDMTERTDGALFVGTPSFTPNWQFFTNNRDAGSHEIVPVFDGGARVRFNAQPNSAMDLWAEGEDWKEPRIAYVQHASDAVVWWSPDLLLTAPDWLSEPAGVDRRVNMVWLPTVTFWQVTLDMFVAGEVPAGHGHAYQLEYTDALAAVTTPAGWSQRDSDLLKDNVSNMTSGN